MSGARDFIIRTEDLLPDKVLGIFVRTKRDGQLVDALKSPTPLIIEGSRGTGKSLLLRVAEQEQLRDFESIRVFPVYVTFAKSSLINTTDPLQFQHWMLARLSSRILRALYQKGLIARPSEAIRILAGGDLDMAGKPMRLEKIAEEFEESYKAQDKRIDDSSIPSVEDFRDAIQDLCEELNIQRINILFDEAAHIFRPEQQRQFFTLFRDLRAPHMTCNAAVYPGVTAYGEAFESTHDAQIEPLNRDILDANYLEQMREIVFKQAESDLQREIERNGENFDALAYAVSGNPRLLLKIITSARTLRSSEVQSAIKEFFRTQIWSEHSGLAERYPGHKELIDWGRAFVEQTTIPDTIKKNEQWKQENKSERTCFIWVHRDAPEAAKEALRLLTYTGILSKLDSGAIATRSQVGTRYAINIGCIAAVDANPISYIGELRGGLSVKRFTEYGASYSAFDNIAAKVTGPVEADASATLAKILSRPISALDLSEYQKSAMGSIGINTILQALEADELKFQKAHYIGPVRARRIKNIATAAVLEYLSG